MSKISFLPTGYEPPKASGGYMKLEDGENRLRILSAPIIGWEDWTADKKPVRFRYENKPSKSIDASRPVRHFWAMIVWNYGLERIQILQIAQAKVRKAIEALCNDTDWGAPYFYDLKIVKKGEGQKTEYAVLALPHKPLASQIKEAFYERRINLDAMFENADPFGDWDVYTDGVFDQNANLKADRAQPFGPSKEQTDELANALKTCSAEFQKTIAKFLEKNKISSDLRGIDDELFTRLERGIANDLNGKKAVGQ